MSAAAKSEVQIASIEQIKQAVREVLIEMRAESALPSPANDSEPTFLKSKEVAKLLRTTTRTVCNLALSGELEHTKIGTDYRFPRAAVLALIQARAGKKPQAKGKK
jgi:excisionase family DNA binding protein